MTEKKKRFKCGICNLATFYTREEFKIHVEMVHNKWKCKKCQKCFEFESKLLYHIDTRHSEIDDVVDRIKFLL